MDVICSLDILINVLYVVILGILVYFLYQLACIAASFRRLINNIEKVSDLSFWGGLIKGAFTAFKRRV
jgi:hypothetical protein